MSAIKMKLDCKRTVDLSFTFIDEYMADCLPVYPLIYIWSLRRLLDGESANFSEIGERFQLTEGDVIKAWKHWEKQGLVSISSDKEGNDTEITFLQVPSKQTDATEPTQCNKTKMPTLEVLDKTKPLPVESRPQYSPDELAYFRTENSDVARIFSRAEKALGKMLSANDMNVIFGFHDWLRLPIDVIEYLLTYCAENEHRNLRYIEKCALDWADRDINNLEKALTYIQGFDNGYREIMVHMGISNYPTPVHRKFMDRWLYEWNMPVEIIIEAIERCIEHINKPTLKYVNGILSSWKEKGAYTMESVAVADDEFKRDKADKTQSTVVPIRTKQNRFVNFNQRDNDYSHYEKLERAYLEQKYKVSE
ncbi:MAG: DnaD domain protein [Defluviitaleaceae bacterium]|nr:DnaD domain protein [Defluviitaleaceae bacterium]